VRKTASERPSLARFLATLPRQPPRSGPSVQRFGQSVEATFRPQLTSNRGPAVWQDPRATHPEDGTRSSPRFGQCLDVDDQFSPVPSVRVAWRENRGVRHHPVDDDSAARVREQMRTGGEYHHQE